MRKTTLVKPLCFCAGVFCLATFGLNWLPAFGQAAAPAAAPAPMQAAAPAKEAPAPAMPGDPKELMLLAAKTNGLIGDDVKPWHLKATYQLFDDQGNVKDQGSYEEFWVSSNKFKRIFTGSAFTQTYYGTEKGLLFSGDQKPQFPQADEVRRQFVSPMPSPESVEKNSYVLQRREAGGVKYACLNFKDVNGAPYGPTWCLVADKPALRVNSTPQGQQAIHNRILGFQGRSIGGDLTFLQQGKKTLAAHIDTLEALDPINEAVFLPPADAGPPPPKMVTISGAVMAGNLIKRTIPDYPPLAQAAGVQGVVVLHAVIGKDGRIRDLHVISGPGLLQQAALDAVKTWAYRPYLLLGEPVEVETQINVVFTLSNPRDERY